MADGELMRARGLFVAEGRLVVQRLLEDERYTVRSVLVNPAARLALGAILSRLEILGRVPSVYVAPAEAFESIVGFKFHRGCLALAERPKEPTVEALVERASLLVVLEGVTNADNVGGVFRNAAAFGVDAVLLSPTCCDPFYRKAIRTSMGATLRVPFARVSDWPAALSVLRGAGFSLVALTPRQPSTPLDEFVTTRKPGRVALIVGTEGPGLSQQPKRWPTIASRSRCARTSTRSTSRWRRALRCRGSRAGRAGRAGRAEGGAGSEEACACGHPEPRTGTPRRGIGVSSRRGWGPGASEY